MTDRSLLATLPDIRESAHFIRAIDTGRIRVDFDEEQAVFVMGRREPSRYERYVKPVIDRVAAAILLLLLAPVLLATALAVRISLGPGVLYRQDRAGLYGRPFTLVKFRTMHPDRRRRQRPIDGPDRRRTHKTPEDPRHTPLGRFLRASSLDELPQLWNVLRGEMSLVGPRPELLHIVEQYAGWQHRRHDVKPGITGLWQVAERDDDGRMHLHVATDLVYVNTVSLWTDLRLLALTVPAVLGRPLRRRGAVEDEGLPAQAAA